MENIQEFGLQKDYIDLQDDNKPVRCAVALPLACLTIVVDDYWPLIEANTRTWNYIQTVCLYFADSNCSQDEKYAAGRNMGKQSILPFNITMRTIPASKPSTNIVNRVSSNFRNYSKNDCHFLNQYVSHIHGGSKNDKYK